MAEHTEDSVTLTPEEKALMVKVLVLRFPELAYEEEEMGGADTVQTLCELYVCLGGKHIPGEMPDEERE